MDKKNKILAQNKKARFEYFIEEAFEAGIELVGTEVKSVRAGKLSLTDCYVDVKSGEALLLGMHISPYEQGNIFNVDAKRPRRLLLHKREIMRLVGKKAEEGYTVIPLSVYLKGSLIKVEIALAKGKKLYDKRESVAKKDAKRNIDRALKARNM